MAGTISSGAQKWTPAERRLHLHWSIPPNVDEDVSRFVMEHDRKMPDTPVTVNPKCILTVHPRVALQNCGMWSHCLPCLRGILYLLMQSVQCSVTLSMVKSAKIQRRPCSGKMLIFVPVEETSDRDLAQPAQPSDAPSGQAECGR